ncbi:TlpA family protein disulfide reductase [Micromonospora sp. NPDC048063]|uniref:TlpA family protein disulfide reductase n=1 Tax=Micromonospora sp. NPDC048063 TaxID=3364256 RepID=UPI00372376DB
MRVLRTRLWPALVLVVTAAVGAGLAAGLDTPDRSAPVGASTGDPAPPIAGTTLDGGRFDLAEVRGHPVLVNVFASWCGPCRDELPLLAEAGRQGRPAGLRVVGINLRDGPDAVRALLRETGAEAMTVVPDPDGTLAIGWGVRGVPETFLVDRDGRVVDRRQGVVTRQWLEQRLGPLLAG